MTRNVYHLIVRVHPPAFRRRFGDEMLSIFDEAQRPRRAAKTVSGTRAATPRPFCATSATSIEPDVYYSSSALLFDGLVSFTRQWLLRSDCWKCLIAIGGGFIQVFGFGMPIEGHQRWTENHQPLTLSVEAVLLFALALTCTLFILITSMTFWNAGFQRRRSQRRKNHLLGLSTTRHSSRFEGRR
ncbi:MAG TPA: hypothetical protein VH325_13855 [Bryobacteraceae bacterium]|jgi:hypothetical protein|nr:hypothetical protein [Bryobacteraceae bacterium]